MATTPKSYKKGSYTYRESSPGSGKYQNFMAASTVKEVRDVSNKKKAEAARKPVTQSKSAGGKPGESKMTKAEQPTSKMSTGPVSRNRQRVVSEVSSVKPRTWRDTKEEVIWGEDDRGNRLGIESKKAPRGGLISKMLLPGDVFSFNSKSKIIRGTSR